MVPLIPAGNGSDAGAGEFRQRMEEEPVYSKGGDIENHDSGDVLPEHTPNDLHGVSRQIRVYKVTQRRRMKAWIVRRNGGCQRRLPNYTSRPKTISFCAPGTRPRIFERVFQNSLVLAIKISALAGGLMTLDSKPIGRMARFMPRYSKHGILDPSCAKCVILDPSATTMGVVGRALGQCLARLRGSCRPGSACVAQGARMRRCRDAPPPRCNEMRPRRPLSRAYFGAAPESALIVAEPRPQRWHLWWPTSARPHLLLLTQPNLCHLRHGPLIGARLAAPRILAAGWSEARAPGSLGRAQQPVLGRNRCSPGA